MPWYWVWNWARPSCPSTFFGCHSLLASSQSARAARPRTGATRKSASSSNSPSRSLRIFCELTRALSASSVSEIRKPCCALPIMSLKLSSSGIILSSSLDLHRLRFLGDTQTDNATQRQFLKDPGNIYNRKCFGRFFFHRCHGDVINAARNDVIERRKLAAHV